MTQVINVAEAIDLIKNGKAILIDVREPDEFKTEHIAYALSIPLSSLEKEFKTLDIPKDKIILFQCLKGSRGQMACERIQGLGSCQNKIMNIDGGIQAWKAHDLPVIGAENQMPKLSIFRQVQIIVGLFIIISMLIGFTGFKTGFILALLFGAALFFAGITGWCGMAIVLAKMPWNR